VLAEIFCRPRLRPDDVSFATFMREHFGRELVDYAIQPFVSGIYAGDHELLSTRHAFPKLWELEETHGSLLRGQLARRRRSPGPRGGLKVISFRRGLQMLPDALAAALPAGSLVCNAQVESIARGPRWSVTWHDGKVSRTEEFAAVVAALPAAALAQLVIGAGGIRPLAALDAVPAPPVASLFLGFRRDQVAHPLDGFGVLVPALEKRAMLGVLFSSTLFPGRAPDGHVALTVMIGGALQPNLARQPLGGLWDSVRGDLRGLLGVNGEPVFQRQAFWPRAIPQYNLGHHRHLAAIAACEQANPGLFIGGNVRNGIALPDCLRAGLALAEKAVQ
jgi:oxygen-dependent protoporphyrinogen oxidase